MNNISYERPRSLHGQAFLIALLAATAMFLPFVLYNKGLFIYIGDFNVQQIPFYKLAHESVRNGDIFWSWYTDLGANFIGSYSFYLIFSPFFWLTLPFPTEAVPYLMAPLLILKTACASLTSYFYIQRFVRDKQYAVVGALLYAFSGFTSYNIFFNHFHEAIVFFPLLLVGLEELLVEDRHGLFALAVAVNAIVNYWFFVGEVVFVVLYYFIRCTSLRGALRKFFRVAAEALLGVGIAMFALLPSVLAVMGNPRTTFPDNLLSGWQFWLYTHEQRQPGIVASFFFPPETPSRPNMFPDHGAKWASLSAWLPVFSMSGVLAFLISVRKNWLRKMILACFVMAMVPGLNSIFIALNHSYYTRWFYMLVLLLCAATAIALDDRRIDFGRGLRWTVIVTAAIALPIGLTPVFQDGELEKIGLAKNMTLFWVYVALAVFSLALCYMVMHYRNHIRFARVAIVAVAVFGACYTSLYIGMSKQSLDGDNYIITNGIQGRANIRLPDDEFYRTDIYDSGDNFGMYWHIPNIQCFHSVVPVSIMEFYPEVGVKRDVSSRPQPEFYALRALFSVKYLFIEQNKEEQEPMPGFALSSRQHNFNIYRNENYVPMGFTYDYYVTRSDFEQMPEENRHKLLLRALVLEDEQVQKYDGMLTRIDPNGAEQRYNYADFVLDVQDRRAHACQEFAIDNRGFTARSNLEIGGLMFFSVPYDKGWSATVNGQPVEIERVDIGFMAVQVPSGECEIRFEYMTPGLPVGIAATLVCSALLILYWFFMRRYTGRRKGPGGHYERFEVDLGVEQKDDALLENRIALDEPLWEGPLEKEPGPQNREGAPGSEHAPPAQAAAEQEGKDEKKTDA